MRIGVDLGGTNLRVAAFGDDATPRSPHREPVGDDRSPDGVIDRIAAAVEQVAAAAGASSQAELSVGVGIAAMLSDRRGTVANSPHLGWRDLDFGPRLAAKLGAGRRVGVYNDVNAITWGEFRAGAAVGARDALAVYVGTGIGAGLVAGGQLVEGATNCAGEIGHVKVRWDAAAAACNCGGRGCLEAYVGGSYVQARARRELAGSSRSLAVQLAGGVDKVTPGDVDAAAAAGDPWALDLWNELGILLGVALANACSVLNPEVLVLGGGMLSRTHLLREHALAAFTIAAPAPISAAVEVRDSVLGDDAGLVGAAMLAGEGVSPI